MSQDAGAMAEDVREGGCLCGAVRFRATLRQHACNACSCDQCRGWGGGPFMALSCDPVEWSGEIRSYASSEWATRGFCPACGSHLYFRPNAAPESLFEITLGAFDDQSGLSIIGEIYCDENPGAYAFAGLERRLTGAECRAAWGKG